MSLVLLFVLGLLCRDGFFAWWSRRAAERLHSRMFTRVLQVGGWWWGAAHGQQRQRQHQHQLQHPRPPALPHARAPPVRTAPRAQAPILFFLRTPVGDTLACFSKDQDTLVSGRPRWDGMAHP